MTAEHPVPRGLPFYVAPTDKDDVNTIRLPVVPICCWRLNDVAFAFDSSFVGPDFAGELTKLATMVKANPGAPASIFAHADPVGSDDVNKTISDRRAIAVYALLTRQIDQWEELYSKPVDGDKWGTKAIQSMLATVQDGSGNPYYGGDIDGKYGPETKQAVEAFQTDAGLDVDGDAGPKTRKVLFGAYMDTICVDSSGKRFLMDPKNDFLGGGADPGGKMAMQGCSELNPVFLLSQDEMSQYQQSGDTKTRNKRNGPNRRVVIFLFRPGTQVPAGAWPCPRVKEGVGACRGQFWPDGDQRRAAGDDERKYQDTHDTMACRFYDRFARRSPCEGGMPAWLEVDLGIDVPEGAAAVPDLTETFILVSDDGTYSQMRTRAEAILLNKGYAVVRFTRVRPGRTYSMFQVFGDVKVPIFLAAPFSGMSVPLPGPDDLAGSDAAAEGR